MRSSSSDGDPSQPLLGAATPAAPRSSLAHLNAAGASTTANMSGAVHSTNVNVNTLNDARYETHNNHNNHNNYNSTPHSGDSAHVSSLWRSPPLNSNDPRFFFSRAPVGSNGGSSLAGSAVSAAATAVGAGVLGLPAAVAQTGWVGVVVLVVVCLMARSTAGRLVRCQYAQKPVRKLRTYGEVGRAAFGVRGEWAAAAAQMATLLSVAILFTILGGANVRALAVGWGWSSSSSGDSDGGSSGAEMEIGVVEGDVGDPQTSADPFWTWSVAQCTIVSGAVVAVPVVALRTMREIAWGAVIGFGSTCFVVAVIAVFGVVRVVQPGHISPSHDLINAESFAYAFATFVFAFGGHSVYPTIQDEMTNKHEYKRMLNWAFILMLALYLPVAVIGYWAFGDEVKSPILLNFLESGQGAAHVITVAATVAITLHCWLTVPIILNPVVLNVERRLGWHPEDPSAPGVPDEVVRVGGRIFFRFFVVCATTAVAVLLPDFGAFMAFVGAGCVAMTVFIFPTLFYMKLFWVRISWAEMVWLCVILMTAVLGSSIGLYSASINFASSVFHAKDVAKLPQSVFYTVVGAAACLGIISISLCVFGISREHDKLERRRNASIQQPSLVRGDEDA